MIFIIHFHSEIRRVDRPQVISAFFRDANGVDRHNHVRQFELALEKKWVTHNPWFRLATTLVGIAVTDTWQLMGHHRLFPFSVSQRFHESEHRNVPIKAMAGNLAAQLFNKAKMMEEEEGALKPSSLKRKRVEQINDDTFTEDDNDVESEYHDDDEDEKRYTFTTNAGKVIEGCRELISYKDGNDNKHTLCKFPVVQTGNNKKKRSRVQSCDSCGKETTYFCFECQKGFCYCSSNKGHGRKCFIEHVPPRSSARLLG